MLTGEMAPPKMKPMHTVLVVDDSWVARLGMNKLLTALGYRVVEAQDGQEALDLIRQNPPDAVFLDLLMPNVGGLAVLEVLGSEKCTVPVFVLTADIQETTVRQCLTLGARSCLAKPPTREAVEASLRTLK